ncbi:MAG: hypothetical protein ACRD3S_03230, partial [Terracidiphilus sp.]
MNYSGSKGFPRSAGDSAAQFIKNGFDCAGQRTMERAARRVFMAAASEPRSDGRNIQFALTTQAYANRTPGDFAQEYHGVDPGGAERRADDAFTIFLSGRGARHILGRDPKPG